MTLLLLAAVFVLSFNDVSQDHPYRQAIEALSSLDIINGSPDGSFQPSSLVTRQQFAKMVVLTVGAAVSESDACPFPDVEDSGPDKLYPDNYVALAARLGITTGKTASSFAPYDNISRAQVMSMVVRAAIGRGIALDQPSPDYYAGMGGGSHLFSAFDDPPHGPNAQKAEFNGLLWGIRLDPGGRWDPWRDATRGEVAQILWRLRQKVDALPPTTTTTAPLAPPTLRSPASGTVFDHYPRTTTLVRDAVPGATAYVLEIQFYSSREWRELTTQTLTQTSFSFDFIGAQAGRWRVATVGEGGRTSRPSEWWTFKYTV